MARVGIDVSVNGSQAATQLKQIQRGVDDLGKSANKIGQALNISGLNRFTEAFAGIGMGPIGWIGIAAGAIGTLVKTTLDAIKEEEKLNKKFNEMSLMLGNSTIELRQYNEELRKLSVDGKTAADGLTSLVSKFMDLKDQVQNNKNNEAKSVFEILGIDLNSNKVPMDQFTDLQNQLKGMKSEGQRKALITSLFSDVTEDQMKILLNPPKTRSDAKFDEKQRMAGSVKSTGFGMVQSTYYDKKEANEYVENTVNADEKEASEQRILTARIKASAAQKEFNEAQKKELSLQEKIVDLQNKLIEQKSILKKLESQGLNNVEEYYITSKKVYELGKELIPLNEEAKKKEEAKTKQIQSAEEATEDARRDSASTMAQIIMKEMDLEKIREKEASESDPEKKHDLTLKRLGMEKDLVTLQNQKAKEAEAMDKKVKAERISGFNSNIKDRRELAMKGLASYAAGINLSAVSQPVKQTNDLLAMIEKHTREAVE